MAPASSWCEQQAAAQPHREVSLLVIRPRAIVFCVLLLCATRQGVGAQQPIAPHAGDYQLFKFQQHIGDEHYEVRRAGATLALTSDFTFTDRGTPVPLHTDAEFQADLTPRSFRTHGKTARESTIDRDIELRGATAIIKDGDSTTNVVAPRRYFMVGGYAPVSPVFPCLIFGDRESGP